MMEGEIFKQKEPKVRASFQLIILISLTSSLPIISPSNTESSAPHPPPPISERQRNLPRQPYLPHEDTDHQRLRGDDQWPGGDDQRLGSDDYWPGSDDQQLGSDDQWPGGDDQRLGGDDGHTLYGERPHGQLVPSATVSLDGRAEFTSIQAAVDHAPDFSERRYIIHIAAGVYEEIVRVPVEKTMLMFLGDGMYETVITGSRSVGRDPRMTTYESATVAVKGDRFMARGIRIVNTAGPEGNQAVALRTESDMAAFYQCAFIGYQDTLNAQLYRQFFKRCLIMGTIDFVFGFAAAIFQDCEIRVRVGSNHVTSNYISAHGRDSASDHTGFVFHRCLVNGTNQFMRAFEQERWSYKTFLGRPWGSYAVTIFLMTNMESLIHPQGWEAWTGKDVPPPNTVIFGEYENVGPGSNPSHRVPWLSHLNSTTILLYDVKNFIQGDSWLPSTGFPFSSIFTS